MKRILLTQGFETLVDDADFSFLNQWKWYANRVNERGTIYAVRTDKSAGKPKKIYLHRLLLTTSKFVDHVDGNTLDNRRANLREASNAQNQHNRGKSRRNSSGYKGVSFHKRDNKWQAKINIKGKAKFLGYFDNPVLASQAYEAKACEIHGEFYKNP